ncbi:hypothetical protein HTZ84_16755 [Haloterrigena sp. SYSU A558-1]|uniref:Uncharacterized protein n=1 Tax=Haloterrigena gelatinilytica TaxID=2741724 RepID=A0A8J8GM40_9EURY|nr:hypothetical protein [Haloterrigena gelatinilytica]NUB90245.1 hypothetical protein [Haloterrigena gelatinilytica]NUC73931.1 hypothetical protein [Haloterrigena gelatinilytica]
MTDTETEDDRIRDEYSEYTADGDVVGVIADPRNDRAWISSTITCDVEQ